MTWSEIAVVAMIALGVIALAAWAAAHRVDRLYLRADTTRAALQTQLLRRSAVALELAGSGLLNPAASLLLSDCALAAQEAGDPASRDVIGAGDTAWRADPASETMLTVALREALGEPHDIEELASSAQGHDLLEALAAAWYRVQVARRFFNDAVADAHYLGTKRIIRVFHLDGQRERPDPFDIDDDMPAGLDTLVSA